MMYRTDFIRSMIHAGWALLLTGLLASQFSCFVFTEQVREEPLSAVDLTIDEEIAELPGLEIRALQDPVHGGQIRWLEAGHTQAGEPPLLLVHGLGSAGMRDFYPLLGELTKKHRVLLLDLPGFARSDKANMVYTPSSYAALLAQLIETQVQGPVDLLGHSLGGATAVELAGSRPQLVRRLVLLDVAVILHREALVASHMSQGMAGLSKINKDLGHVIDSVARTLLEPVRGLEPDLVQLLTSARSRKLVLSSDPMRIATLSFILHNFGPALSRIEAPTLILWGRQDTTAPLRTAHLLHSRIAKSKLIIMEGVKHEPQIEAPEAVLLELQNHLEKEELDLGLEKAPPAGLASREARCDQQSDVVFEGGYRVIEIKNCERVFLNRVWANRILIESSSVEMLDPTLVADPAVPGPALLVKDSDLIVTGGRLWGRPAMKLEHSNLDMAGTRLYADQDPVWQSADSRALFSVTEMKTQNAVLHLHAEQ